MATTVFDTPTDSKQDKSDNTLTTTAKTVVGAINELDGDLAALLNSTSKTVSSDFNDCKTAGCYKGSTGSSTSNLPAAGYWTLLVVQYSANDLAQLAFDVNNNKVYSRTFHDNTTWTSWVRIDNAALDEAKAQYYDVAGKSVLNFVKDLRAAGHCYGTFAINGSTYAGAPSTSTWYIITYIIPEHVSGCVTLYASEYNTRNLYVGKVWVTDTAEPTWQQLASASDLGSPSSASAVTGADAFSKINTLNSKFITQIGNSKVDAGISNGNGIRTINFNKAFSYAPAIALTPLIASDSSATSYIRTCVIEEITATQCKFREVAQQIGGSTFVDGTDPVYWIAVSS